MKFVSHLSLDQLNLRRVLYVRRFLVFAAGVIVLALLVLVVAVIPEIFGDIDLQNKLQDEQKLLVSLNQKVDALQQSVYLSNNDNLRRVNLALPSEKPLLPLLATVNSTAANTSVIVSEVETSPGKLATGSAKNTTDNSNFLSAIGFSNSPDVSPVRGVQPLNIQITVRGSLSQVNTFIQQLEQSTPFVNLSQIALTAVDTATSTSSVGPQTLFEAKLSLSTYYFTEPIQVTVDAPLPEITQDQQNLLQSLSTFIFPQVQTQQTIQGGGLNDLFGVNKGGIVPQK